MPLASTNQKAEAAAAAAIKTDSAQVEPSIYFSERDCSPETNISPVSALSPLSQKEHKVVNCISVYYDVHGYATADELIEKKSKNKQIDRTVSIV